MSEQCKLNKFMFKLRGGRVRIQVKLCNKQNYKHDQTKNKPKVNPMRFLFIFTFFFFHYADVPHTKRDNVGAVNMPLIYCSAP